MLKWLTDNQIITHMPIYLSQKFIEFDHNGLTAQRYDFSIETHNFVVIFSEVITDDPEYHALRSEEAGFRIPKNCYDVKFDRLENFESEEFYAPPPKGKGSRRFNFSLELADALETIITVHHNIYKAKAYLAVADTPKLKRFYDRVLQKAPDDVICEVKAELGEGGMGYVLKTRYF
ncbi:hypothetical protein C7423_11341 [Pantoea ananatis]|nr:hypothetical protein C7426_11259 [Pantoea ananatis]REC89171.1 hypothetical protein C7423_11341 [Pantoea ananatis]